MSHGPHHRALQLHTLRATLAEALGCTHFGCPCPPPKAVPHTHRGTTASLHCMPTWSQAQFQFLVPHCSIWHCPTPWSRFGKWKPEEEGGSQELWLLLQPERWGGGGGSGNWAGTWGPQLNPLWVTSWTVMMERSNICLCLPPSPCTLRPFL